MAYRNLYNPLSQFVDPGSTEIGKELANRYLTNFGTASELETELANFVAAPFESDKKYRDEIVQSTQQSLTGVAERGDYENMTIPVLQSAKQYSKESAPIKQNYALYTDYVKKLEEAYDAGDIDYEDYQGTLALSNYTYKGIQRDAQGNYGNLYGGLDIITDPKIEERINEALNGIVAEEGSKERQSVGEGSAGQYTIKTEQGFKTVSKARVSQVMDMVMSDPQVRDYINRKAQIKYGMADESVLAEEGANQLKSLSALHDQYEQAANETKDKDTKQAYLDAMNSIQARAGRLASMQDPEQLRSYLMSAEAARIDELYRRGAEARFSYSSQTKDSRIVSWDQKYLKTLDSTGGSRQNISLTVPGQLTEVVSPSGTSIYNKRTAQVNLRKRREDMSQEGYFDDLGIPGLTLEAMESMTQQDFINSTGGQANPEQLVMFNRMKNSVRELQSEEYALTQVMREAGAATGETKEKRVKNAIESNDELPELLAGISKAYGVDNPTALTYLQSFLNYYEAEALADPDEDPQSFGEAASTLYGFDYDLLQSPAHPEDFEQVFNEISPRLWTETFVSSRTRMSKGIRNALQKSDEELDKYIESVSVRQSTPTVSATLLGMTKAENDQLNDLFANTSPHANGEAFVSSRTGQLVAFDKILEEQGVTNTDDIRSKGKVKFNPAHTGPLGPTMQITYEVGKDNIPVIAHIPMSQIQGSPGIDSYNASMGMRFIRSANVQRNHGVENIYITAVLPPNTNIQKPEGMEIGFKVDMENKKLIIVDELGRPTSDPALDLEAAINSDGYINAQLPSMGFNSIREGLPR